MVLNGTESAPDDVASDHTDVEIGSAEEKVHPDPVTLTINAIVTEVSMPDDSATLPDFGVYCSVIDASTTTVSRLITETSA